MEGISITPSLFWQGINAKSFIFLKVAFIYYLIVHLNCLPEGTGGRKTRFPLQVFYNPKQNIHESTLAAALLQFLKDHPYIYDIALYLEY